MQLGGTAIFCDTFDKKNPGIPSRTGDLDPNVWGVSRARPCQFGSTRVQRLGAPPCFGVAMGQRRSSRPAISSSATDSFAQASNDNPTRVFDAGDVTVLAMYPKQPFDLAGRTGTVSFDISNDLHGTHAAWPEFWLSNLPVPTPFNHFDSWQALPEHGLGIRFAAAAFAGQYGYCPNGNNLDKMRWTVDLAVVVRNYVMDDTVGMGGVRTRMAVQATRLCYLAAGRFRNYESRRAQDLSKSDRCLRHRCGGRAISVNSQEDRGYHQCEPVILARIDLAPGCSLQFGQD